MGKNGRRKRKLLPPPLEASCEVGGSRASVLVGDVGVLPGDGLAHLFTAAGLAPDKGAVCAPPASTCPASEAECSVDTNAAVTGAWDSGSPPPPTAAGVPRASRRQRGQSRSQSKAPTTTDIPAAVLIRYLMQRGAVTEEAGDEALLLTASQEGGRDPAPAEGPGSPCSDTLGVKEDLGDGDDHCVTGEDDIKGGPHGAASSEQAADSQEEEEERGGGPGGSEGDNRAVEEEGVEAAAAAGTATPASKGVPEEIRLDVFVRDDWRCGYCFRRYSPDKRDGLTVDHVIPISAGGPNLAENLLAACSEPCNTRKGPYWVEDLAWKGGVEPYGLPPVQLGTEPRPCPYERPAFTEIEITQVNHKVKRARVVLQGCGLWEQVGGGFPNNFYAVRSAVEELDPVLENSPAKASFKRKRSSGPGDGSSSTVGAALKAAWQEEMDEPGQDVDLQPPLKSRRCGV